MTLYLLLNHLLNFIAPAALTALLLVGFSRLFPRFLGSKDALAPGWPVQFGVNFAAGLAVLVLGLVVLGRDGKMMTYLALILVTATNQWWQLGEGRQGWAALKSRCIRKR